MSGSSPTPGDAPPCGSAARRGGGGGPRGRHGDDEEPEGPPRPEEPHQLPPQEGKLEERSAPPATSRELPLREGHEGRLEVHHLLAEALRRIFSATSRSTSAGDLGSAAWRSNRSVEPRPRCPARPAASRGTPARGRRRRVRGDRGRTPGAAGGSSGSPRPRPAATSFPASMIPTVLQMLDSSVRMCDETMIVFPIRWSSLSSSRNSIRARGSSPEAGSSRIRTRGSWRSVFARQARCFMPRRERAHLVVPLRAQVREGEDVVDRPSAASTRGIR